MSDSVSTTFDAGSGKPMFATTKFGGYAGVVLASLTILFSAYSLMVGVTGIGKGAVTFSLLFNGIFLAYAYFYFMGGRKLENRTSGGLVLFVVACASGLGVAIVSGKNASYMLPAAIYAGAYLLAWASFIWDLSDDR